MQYESTVSSSKKALHVCGRAVHDGNFIYLTPQDFIPESLSLGKKDFLAREVEKHLRIQVADSSALDLELHLEDPGHVYEALVFFFLEIHPIRTAIHKLKVTLPQSKTTNTVPNQLITQFLSVILMYHLFSKNI